MNAAHRLQNAAKHPLADLEVDGRRIAIMLDNVGRYVCGLARLRTVPDLGKVVCVKVEPSEAGGAEFIIDQSWRGRVYRNRFGCDFCLAPEATT